MRTLRFAGPVIRPDQGLVDDALARSTTVVELLDCLGYARHHQPFLQVFVAGRRLAPSDALPPEAEITLVLPMGGG